VPEAAVTTEANASRQAPKLGRFVAAVGLAGFVAIAQAVWTLPSTPRPLEWIAFGVLALIAGSFALKIPGVPAHLSVSDTFFITSVLLFGPAPATVAIALDSFVMSWRRGHPATRMLFNTANPALAIWVAAQAFFALADVAPLATAPAPPGALVLPLAVLTTIYFLLNTGLTATAVALEKGQPAAAIWGRYFGLMSLNYFAAASASFFLIVLVRYVSVIALSAVLPLLAIFYLAMRSWLGRLDDAQQHVATVNRLYLSTIEAFSTAIEAKDGVTSTHIHRVQSYALGLARALGITDDSTLKAIEAAALLHDTGKLAVPEHILNKPGKLTPVEFETMKLHVDVGADILSSIDFPYPVVPIVRCHHENWDGSGYPRGIRGAEIPLGARILSVVDCFDALTSDRPYRPAMTDEQALAIVLERRGTMYDPEVVDAFVRVHRSIAPAHEPRPQLQEAVRKISRSAVVEPPRAPAVPAEVEPADLPGELLAVISLGRIVSGHPRVGDVALMAWTHLQRLVPASSCAFFIPSGRTDVIAARYAAGEHAAVLQNLSMGVGQRLSGWVAAHRRPIVNSDASLDLGKDEAANLRYCLSTPLVAGNALSGVVTLYAPTPFSDDHARIMQLMAPHLADMLARVARLEEAFVEPAGPEAAPRPAERGNLRVVMR
jgi:putative nucleotidyltransferase with HDIG domain